jgi:hypothetical protein
MIRRPRVTSLKLVVTEVTQLDCGLENAAPAFDLRGLSKATINLPTQYVGYSQAGADP